MLTIIGLIWVQFTFMLLVLCLGENTVLNAMKEMTDFLGSPLFSVCIQVHKFAITTPVKPVVKPSNDTQNWDIVVFEDDVETEILWNGQVSDTTTTAKVAWFGDMNSINLFQEDVVNYKVALGARRFNTYVEECDFIPSAKTPIDWKNSLKGCFKTDPISHQREFFWL